MKDYLNVLITSESVHETGDDGNRALHAFDKKVKLGFDYAQLMCVHGCDCLILTTIA